MTAFNVVGVPFGGLFFGLRRSGVLAGRFMGRFIIICSVFPDGFLITRWVFMGRFRFLNSGRVVMDHGFFDKGLSLFIH